MTAHADVDARVDVAVDLRGLPFVFELRICSWSRSIALPTEYVVSFPW